MASYFQNRFKLFSKYQVALIIFLKVEIRVNLGGVHVEMIMIKISSLIRITITIYIAANFWASVGLTFTSNPHTAQWRRHLRVGLSSFVLNFHSTYPKWKSSKKRRLPSSIHKIKYVAYKVSGRHLCSWSSSARYSFNEIIAKPFQDPTERRRVRSSLIKKHGGYQFHLYPTWRGATLQFHLISSDIWVFVFVILRVKNLIMDRFLSVFL